MKFTDKDYNLILDHFKSLGIDNILEHQKNSIKENYSQVRFVWAIFWASKVSKTEQFRQADYLDAHIQTAITKATRELLGTNYSY